MCYRCLAFSPGSPGPGTDWAPHNILPPDKRESLILGLPPPPLDITTQNTQPCTHSPGRSGGQRIEGVGPGLGSFLFVTFCKIIAHVILDNILAKKQQLCHSVWWHVQRGERSVSSVSAAWPMSRLWVRAGASLVTLCPNELYAKQIPPILRSHGETQPGLGKNTAIFT